MSLPIREQIIQAIADRVGASRSLETIDAADLPVTVLVAGEDSVTDDESYDTTPITLPVTIARAEHRSGLKGDDWHTAANELLAELITSAYAGGENLNGLADGIDYAGGATDVLSDGATGVMAQVNLDIRYQIARGNPYTQEVT